MDAAREKFLVKGVDGQIRFLNDSTHELAGQTVDLPDEFSDHGDYKTIAESKL